MTEKDCVEQNSVPEYEVDLNSVMSNRMYLTILHPQKSIFVATVAMLDKLYRTLVKIHST